MIAEKILKHLDIDFEEIGLPQSGYRNKSYCIKLKNGKKVNLIIYKSEVGILKKIKAANAVGIFLNKKGLNVRYPISKIVKLSNPKTGFIKFACVYNYLEGETIPWEGYVSKHIKLLGGEMGRMHKTIINYKFLITNYDECIQILKIQLNTMEKYFADSNVKAAMLKKLGLNLEINFEEFRSVFKQLSNEESQILHMDLVRSNVLFKLTPDSNISISGIIDFEKVCVGPKILDIARTLAFLIVDCKYKKEEKVRKYFLLNGYQKRGENKLPDLTNLEILLRYFWLYDFYKFLKHNPYESLVLNEHYLRTVDRLVSSRL